VEKGIQKLAYFVCFKKLPEEKAIAQLSKIRPIWSPWLE
jgi:hypothetical protein